MPAATGIRLSIVEPLRRAVPAGRGAELRERAGGEVLALDARADDDIVAARRARASARRRGRSAGPRETSGCRPSARGAPTSRHRLTLPGAVKHSRSHSARQSRGRERLGARVGGVAERDQRLARAVADVAVRAGRQRERAGERLAAVGEAVLHERAQACRRRRAVALRPTSTESTFGTGWKTLRGILRDDAHVAGELGEHGRHAVAPTCSGAAAKRSPTSFCTIATHVSTVSSSIVRRITVAATPYGQVGDDLVRRAGRARRGRA